MKLLKPRNFVVFAMTALSGTVLLHTSQSVQHAEDRLMTLQSSVDREEEKTRLLKAEWASLNRPERLEKLAKEFLDLVPPQPEMLVKGAASIPDKPSPEEDKALFEDEGAGAALQPVSAQTSTPAKSAEKTADQPPAKDDKKFGELMNELSTTGGGKQ
jgi:cell division protein FtsL